MTPQQWTTGPGATLPGPVAALILVAVVVLFAAGLCGHAAQPRPGPWRALRRAYTARRSPNPPRPSRKPQAPTQGRTAQEQT